MRMLIIADDLSGAADCAIGFASAGLQTVVTLDPLNDKADAQVIAADTDTRRLSSARAAERTVAAFKALRSSPGSGCTRKSIRLCAATGRRKSLLCSRWRAWLLWLRHFLLQAVRCAAAECS